MRIGERHCVDGALKKTLHARALLDQDIDLVIRLNPLVPFDATEMFGANTFSYSARRQLAEHAYQSTRANPRTRRRALHAMVEPHGIAIADKVLDDPARRLVTDTPRLAPAWHDVAPDRLGGALRRLGGVPGPEHRPYAGRLRLNSSSSFAQPRSAASWS